MYDSSQKRPQNESQLIFMEVSDSDFKNPAHNRKEPTVDPLILL